MKSRAPGSSRTSCAPYLGASSAPDQRPGDLEPAERSVGVHDPGSGWPAVVTRRRIPPGVGRQLGAAEREYVDSPEARIASCTRATAPAGPRRAVALTVWRASAVSAAASGPLPQTSPTTAIQCPPTSNRS